MQTAELLALGKAMNIYINCLMFYPSRQHVKRNHFKYTGLNSTMISWCWRFHVLSCWRFFPCHLSHRYVMKMYCPPVTILGYTSQNRQFEKFINIHSNKKKLEEEFNNSFSEAVARSVLYKLLLKIWQYSAQENICDGVSS